MAKKEAKQRISLVLTLMADVSRDWTQDDLEKLSSDEIIRIIEDMGWADSLAANHPILTIQRRRGKSVITASKEDV